MIGIYGIPFTGSYDLTQDRIYAVAGADAVNRFSEAQLQQLMSRKVLLDGAAAVALTQRGFASSMGVSADMSRSSFRLISKRPRRPRCFTAMPLAV